MITIGIYVALYEWRFQADSMDHIVRKASEIVLHIMGRFARDANAARKKFINSIFAERVRSPHTSLFIASLTTCPVLVSMWPEEHENNRGGGAMRAMSFILWFRINAAS